MLKSVLMLKLPKRSGSKSDIPKFYIVLFESYRSWVIEGMFKDALQSIHINAKWIYIPDSRKSLLKLAVAYFEILRSGNSLKVFANHKTFLSVPRFKFFLKGPVRVYVTHIMEWDHSLDHTSLKSLSRVERFIVQNSKVSSYLKSLGVDKSNVIVNPGGVDKKFFYPAQRFDQISDYVLVSGSFRARKNPELIAEVIANNPTIKFIVHGNNLDQFPNEVGPNVDFISFNFQNQPKLMREARVHLILSQIEGGPMSVLEALSSGTPCVTTDVGFCRELIPLDGGIVLNLNPGLSEIQRAIEEMWLKKEEIYNVDLLRGTHPWESFARDLFL